MFTACQQNIFAKVCSHYLNMCAIASAYRVYKQALVKTPPLPKHAIILKFDDLVNYNKTVKRLDRYIKKYNLKACWGIIGKSFEQPSTCYCQFIKQNQSKNYTFFNHGYEHLGGPVYEFVKQSVSYQETQIRKTQDIVYQCTQLRLNVFGAPCNHIDSNTKLALENIPDIKFWFYGLEDYKGVNIKRVIDMENGVGNPDFIYFLDKLSKFNTSPQILTLQGHPYMWKRKQRFNFYLIVQFLLKSGCTFILPHEIGDKHD